MQEQLGLVCDIEEGSKNLAVLRELTHKLPEFANLVRTRAPGYVEMITSEGNSFGLNLLNQREISVAKWFGSKETIFQKHSHREKEWIIVYDGSINLIYDYEVKTIKAGEYCFHEPEVPHGATFDEDCWFLAITIPSSADWPK